jgi:hypothetical protein
MVGLLSVIQNQQSCNSLLIFEVTVKISGHWLLIVYTLYRKSKVVVSKHCLRSGCLSRFDTLKYCRVS